MSGNLKRGIAKGWLKKDGTRRAPHGTKLPGRISKVDLAAGIYPDGDVRNTSEVRRWMAQMHLDSIARKAERRFEPHTAPSSLWLGPRTHCPHCGALSAS